MHRSNKKAPSDTDTDLAAYNQAANSSTWLFAYSVCQARVDGDGCHISSVEAGRECFFFCVIGCMALCNGSLALVVMPERLSCQLMESP